MRPGEEGRRNEIAPRAFSPPERSDSRVTRLPTGRSSISMPASMSSSSPSSSGSVRRSRPRRRGTACPQPRRSGARRRNVSANRRSTVSVSSFQLGELLRLCSRSARCSASSVRRSFPRSYSSFANGLTLPRLSRRSSRSSFVVSSSEVVTLGGVGAGLDWYAAPAPWPRRRSSPARRRSPKLVLRPRGGAARHRRPQLLGSSPSSRARDRRARRRGRAGPARVWRRPWRLP